MASIATCLSVTANSHHTFSLKPPLLTKLSYLHSLPHHTSIHFHNALNLKSRHSTVSFPVIRAGLDIPARIKPGNRVQTDGLPTDVRKRAMDAVDSSGGRVTIGDVSSKAGLKSSEAQKALQALAADTGGFLEKVLPKDVAVEEDFDEDAIEALFNLLEEDLKNDLSPEEGADELTEEDLAKLEQELEEALGSDDEFSEMHNLSSENMLLDNDDDIEEDSDGDDDEEERPVVLRKWQLRRLASALKIGRRKTSIQSLAAELCLDRAVVLELLRNPPPDLLLLSAALPDRVVQTTSAPETKLLEHSNELPKDVLEPEPETDTEPMGKQPIHVMQSRWSLQKRLKKVQVETLERVYNRTKRPTNAMISSVVHVTNLPRKRVIKWFEDKRAEDGVPYNRLPFERSTSENIVTK